MISASRSSVTLSNFQLLWYHRIVVIDSPLFGQSTGRLPVVMELSELEQDLPNTAPANPAASVARVPSRDDGLVDSLLRLGVGGVSLGARIALQPLALLGEFTVQGSDKTGAGEPGAPPPSTSERVMETAVGAAVETGELARRGARTVQGINRRVWRMTEPARRPLEALGVTDLVQRPVRAFADRVESQVETLQAAGRSEVEASRQRVIGTLGGTIDGIIAYLSDNAQVDALIGAQIDKLLPLLSEHPAVERLIEVQVDKILPKLATSAAIQALILAQVNEILPELADDPGIQQLVMAQVDAILPELAESAAILDLIRVQGDKYIDYLNEHPDKVQNLISGQSVGLAGQMLDEVRERTVTADSVTEMIVRNLLKKKPRSELAEPPDMVQARAASRILPSDFVHRKEPSNDR
jgi:pimeloyl-ACP methyl ester carboxylesterase